MIFLQQPVNATDLYFRITDVVMLVGGILTLAAMWFATQYKIQKLKDDMLNNITLFNKEIDGWKEKHGELLHRVTKGEREVSAIEDKLMNKMDQMMQTVQGLSNKIETTKTEILERILNSKKP